MKKLAILIALAVAGCSSARSASDLLHAPEHPGTVGTPPAPGVAWAPPPSAVPAAVERETKVTLPVDVQPGSAITLAQAVDVALTNNPATRAAWFDTRAAEAALGSRRSAYLPEIDLNAGLGRGRTSQGTVQTSFTPSLSLTYLLFDFGGRAAQVEEARQALIASAYSNNQTIQNVVLRTQQAYYTYLDAKALVAAQAATVRERQAALDAANARHGAGVATVADVLQARTALSQAQLSYETFEGNLRSAEGSLSTVMGLSPTMRFTAGDLPADLPVDTVAQNVDQLIAQAEAQRPDLAAARATVFNARARIREVRSQGLPAVGLSSSVGRSVGIAGANSSNTYSAGVNLRFPLFTGFRNTYDVRQAEEIAQATQEDTRSLADQVALQVWNSYYALQTAAQRVRTSRDLLASALEAVNAESGRYKAGVGSIIDLLTAQAALENARAQEVQSRADWLSAVAQLAHDTGTLGPQPQGK